VFEISAAAHSSDDMMKGIENNWETRKLFMPTAAKISMV
jgi:hypothetical protein